MNQLGNFPYKHALVLGLAKSGAAAANTLLRNGIKVTINDYRTEKDAPIVNEFTKLGAEVIVGSHPLSVLDGVDIIVKNPGISYDNIILSAAANLDIPIITEIELASLLLEEHDIIGITGSNGKTTTTSLVHQMLVESKQSVKLAGNIGIVATEVAEKLEKDEKLILELSSFQLMGVHKFKPRVAALLNLFEAHLDYHGSIEAYIEAKKHVFMNQTAEDFTVYNLDDEKVVTAIKESNATLVPFSIVEKHINGAWLDNEYMYFKEEPIIRLKDIVLVGDHNKQNILAAIAIAMLMGATKAGIYQVLTTFSGVEHRLQYVANKNERLFYNDSKATNMLATEKALQSFTQPIILLAGGLDRGDDYEDLVPYLNNVKEMIVFGETAEKLKTVAIKENIIVHQAIDVREAVHIAYEDSKEGDVILLSPACASWDQYKTFEERGNMFIQAVHTLA